MQDSERLVKDRDCISCVYVVDKSCKGKPEGTLCIHYERRKK